VGLGIRFDDRATGKISEFCPRARVVHIDIDPSELGKIRQPTVGFVADVGIALDALEPLVAAAPRAAWRERADTLRAAYPLVMPDADDPCSPYGIVRHAAALAGPDAIVTSDVGQHQMWAAQAYPFTRPRQWLTPRGLGPRRFGLPPPLAAAPRPPRAPAL